MKKILIVVALASVREDNMNWLPLRDEMQKVVGDSVSFDMTSLTSLIFDISNEGCSVTDSRSGKDVASYDMVVIRNVGKTLELGITLAHYLRMKKVDFTDSYLEMRGSGKLSCAILRLREGLPTPRTVVAKPKLLGEYIRTAKPFEYPFILKADNGKKGRNNYLVKDQAELDQILNDNLNIQFVAQEHIPNNGDFRALVLNDEISLVIERKAAEGTHLSNTSQGGSANLFDAVNFSHQVRTDIIKSAQVEGLQVAGVDIMFDNRTGKHYFLEVNRAPQIGTGAFANQKIAAYARMIEKRAKEV
jgi:glutathione synthase/RimK-type ligase-like ATP-grasp enzyme